MRPEVVRLHPYIDRELAKQVATYGEAMGMTTSSVVQAALRQYLHGTSDMTLIMRRLDRLSRAWNRTQRDLEIQMEAFGLFVKLWFAHTPRVPDEAKEFARRTAESRFGQFQQHLIEQLQGGHRFIDDLPREEIADEAELTTLASQASAAPTVAEPPSGTDEE